MNYQKQKQILNSYLFCSYIGILGLSLKYFESISFDNLGVLIFSIVVFLTYGVTYLLPTVVIAKILQFVLKRLNQIGDKETRGSWAVYGTAVFLSFATGVLLYVDRTIFSLFGFHLNGFFWTLVTTPGGIESLGGGADTTVTYALMIFIFLMMHVMLLLGIRRVHINKPQWIPRLSPKAVTACTALFIFFAVGERVTYAYFHAAHYAPIRIAADSFPFYMPVTSAKLEQIMGIEKNGEVISFPIRLRHRAPRYPLKDLKVTKPDKPLNIVLLVAESWRWDMLNPEIMPATWSFAEKSHHFLKHYSGGIGTRPGLFALFYGIYGHYWNAFLDQETSPILLDILQDQNYQFDIRSGALFSYPEFNKTFFLHIPRENLTDANDLKKTHHIPKDKQLGYYYDRLHVSGFIEFLKKRDKSRPFLGFIFFESPHTRYSFPKENIIRANYLESFNYATMDLEEDIELIKNRYINSCHHLDSQYKRIIDHLRDEDLLDNTIVIITGDHGEEFMEKGRWGHNSAFSEEQLRIPMVIWIPGTGSSQVQRLTSHLDIPPTLLPMLGLENHPEEYSLGLDLFGKQKRKYTVATFHTRVCYIDDDYKATFSIPAKAIQPEITRRDDSPVKDNKAFYKSHRDVLFLLRDEMERFSKE